jgi:formate dehydrogenase subunit delta
MNSQTAREDHGKKPDPAEKLFRMADEIAGFFKSYPEDQAADSLALHINRYWTPKMRAQFLAAMDAPDRTLPPLLQAARTKIKRSKVEE